MIIALRGKIKNNKQGFTLLEVVVALS
ncbi:MAG: prepilin-type N-terminal cleavage/methylation domain-containing protein, partial [Candidatus Poribacteria bacterium]